MAFDRQWFTDLLADRKLSQRQFAKKLGVDPASVHRLLTEKRPMRFDEATSISRLLGVPVSQVLEHAGLDMKAGTETVPLVGYVDGQGELHVDWNVRGTPVMAPVDLPAGTVAVQMHTAASPLEPMDGWTLFVKIPNGVEPDALGRLCLVGTEGNGVQLLRFVRRGYKRGRVNLIYPGLGELQDVVLAWATAILHIVPSIVLAVM